LLTFLHLVNGSDVTISVIINNKLSVPTNSVDAEHSVSQYTAVNALQKQSFSDTNLALQVMAAFSARA